MFKLGISNTSHLSKSKWKSCYIKETLHNVGLFRHSGRQTPLCATNNSAESLFDCLTVEEQGL